MMSLGWIQETTVASLFIVSTAVYAVDVPLYRTFETEITNNQSYSNKFIDVELLAKFTSPSGEETDFFGFYNGDGAGGGSKSSGNSWGLRFMPDEVGRWNYTWRFSDDSKSGEGAFECVAEGAGKGIIRAYEENPYWFAYEGTEPVFIKSYYTCDHLNEDPSWAGPNVWAKIKNRGYNHIQTSGLPIAYIDETWDGEQGLLKEYLFLDNDPTGKMQLDVWKRVDGCLKWFSDHDMYIHLFQGFHGKKEFVVDWGKLSTEEKEFYVKYVVARLAPYPTLAGWNFTWEIGGAEEWAALVEQYDVFNHLRTYHDEGPSKNSFEKSVYTFAAVENHGYDWSKQESRSHHQACLDGYKGKPVYMSEGNGLWHPCWNAGDSEKIMQSAWGCTMAGASFCWQWVGKNCQDYTNPNELFAPKAAEYIDIMYDIMENKVQFETLKPRDSLLSDATPETYCLAEPGRQYLVYAESGGSFNLAVEAGNYNATWINLRTGDMHDEGVVETSTGSKSFTSPSTATDWMLLMKIDQSTGSIRQLDKHSEAVIFVGSDGLHIPSAPGVTHLSILDLRGRKIAQISNDATISLRYRGMGLPNGVYLIKARRKQASVRLRSSVVK